MQEPNEHDTAPDDDEDLSASVERGPRSQAVLTVLRGPKPGTIYTIDGQESVLGRSPDVEVPLLEEKLSRKHARIVRLENAFAIEDLGSTNGTFVDGERVEGIRVLEDGCRIFLGTRIVLHFRLHDEVELEVVRQTQALALRDPLTGLFNRRHLQDHLWSEAAYARRHHTPLSLLLLDLDHFKSINDTYGHAVGDDALRLVADALTKLTRMEDVLARYGGEEFALVTRGIGRDATLQLAERIRRTVEQQTLDVNGHTVRFTVSIGIAHSGSGEDAQPQHMFEAADRALYSAKDAGRNRASIKPIPT